MTAPRFISHGMLPRARSLRSRDGGPPPTWAERLAALRYVPPLLKLVYQTHRGYTVAILALRAVRSFVPLAVLWVGKLIIDGVIAAVRLARLFPVVPLDAGAAAARLPALHGGVGRIGEGSEALRPLGFPRRPLRPALRRVLRGEQVARRAAQRGLHGPRDRRDAGLLRGVRGHHLLHGAGTLHDRRPDLPRGLGQQEP